MISFLGKYKRAVSIFLTFLFVFQLVPVASLHALTSGPTQPEVQGFQPVGTTDMVDLFTGDFGYNIPLFELPGPNGGYPFNLAYQAGVSMDQEASWVGLGWSLTPGSINRTMRGIPDEFKGDEIETKMSIKPDITVGLGAGIGVEVFGGKLGIELGLTTLYSNYKGIGYSIDGNFGFSKVISGMTSRIGLGFSLNPDEGVSLAPSLSLGNEVGSIGLGVGYHSRAGMTGISANISSNKSISLQNKDKTLQGINAPLRGGATFSFAHLGYTPQISMPMRGINLTGKFNFGGDWWGVEGYAFVNGFYNEQRLKNDKKVVPANSYGYLYFQNSTSKEDVFDVNREKDGMVSSETPNLAIPSLTYDIYSVVGQGISAQYRPVRNDFGVVTDPEVVSSTTSIGAGVEVAPGASKGGVNLSVTHGYSRSGDWDDTDLGEALSFKKDRPWSFKAHGESTVSSQRIVDKIGGEKAKRFRLSGSTEFSNVSARLENNFNPDPDDFSQKDDEKVVRNQVIEPITNEQLISNGNEILKAFDIQIIDSNGSTGKFNRSSYPLHHIAGFTALTPEGLRYTYGIPAYNLHHEEVSFSTKKNDDTTGRVDTGDNGDGDPDYDQYDETNKFLKRVEIPKYAHSYLLTSIVGPDYVDVDNNGVSDKDLGYWVKFTYQRTENYKWRDPFTGAHHQEGWKTDRKDGQGSFTYGEKEMWFLKRAETKSHVATFSISKRKDARGASQKLQNETDPGTMAAYTYQLDAITLTARDSDYPIKTAKFNYDYSLCTEVENNDGTGNGTGKLTLLSLRFEYGTSTRGRLNPYEFVYDDLNPKYNNLEYDRWGNYKKLLNPESDPLQNHDFPYTDQDSQNKDLIDSYASAWSLKEIRLPSGGLVMVDYETDDYSFVQNKQAMQMSTLEMGGGDAFLLEDDADPNPADDIDDDLVIKFKLQQPIAGDLDAEKQREEVLKYLDGRQLYFKIRINIQEPYSNQFEYISGYAEVDFEKRMTLEKVGNDYAIGTFHLKREDGRHPFSLRAWQHLRTNQPDLAYPGPNILEPGGSTSSKIDQIKSLAGIFTQLRQVFGGFNHWCDDKNWGREIDPTRSLIRLNSIDKIKYGGGLRVRQITMKDQWAESDEGYYGQIYEYTDDEDGMTISSGVAAYEPLIGGDENALRYAKKFANSIPLRADNNLFFEYPINESYYPGPQVGYRKVTVSSLISAKKNGKPVLHAIYPDDNSMGSTGITVHEFYTAKDFPVITDETDKDDLPYKLNFVVPFVGNVSISKLTSTQGYSTVLNDMHGKPKKVSNYRQDLNGKPEPDPISWVKYNYFTKKEIHGRIVSEVLDNQFVEAEGNSSLLRKATVNDSGSRFTIGQESDFTIDMREFNDIVLGGGFDFNLDIIFLFLGAIPLPTSWPDLSGTHSQLRTVVTNKIIFKSGILKSTEAYDGGSLIRTENHYWDKQTGEPVVTIVNNNFDDPIYSMNIPAHTKYKGMGAAYKNIGLIFSVNGVHERNKQYWYEFTPGVSTDNLFPGDEVILYPEGGQTINPIDKGIYLGIYDGVPILYCESSLQLTNYTAMITRSGYRNQLTVSAGNITALKDPTLGGTPITYSKSITVPKEN